ncbi:MAG: hypothetical protein KGJ23_09465 [Euryarchaeota archaeon]|nr:hypothetical protein [Euryarchaeota archaeon]MDE1882039.1 hypothetical protein [Euryarchaeota archaeon]MDE2044814.1 hypothetical protein [Thermoplasmata archaeon]
MSTKRSIRWSEDYHLYVDYADPFAEEGVFLRIDRGLCKAVELDTAKDGLEVTVRLPPEVAPILHPDVRKELRQYFRRPTKRALARQSRQWTKTAARWKRQARERLAKRASTPLASFDTVWKDVPSTVVEAIESWRRAVLTTDPERAEQIARWYEGHTPEFPRTPEQERRWKKIMADLRRRSSSSEKKRKLRTPVSW